METHERGQLGLSYITSFARRRGEWETAGARKRGRETASHSQPLDESRILFSYFHHHVLAHSVEANLLLSSGDVMITSPSPQLINYSGLIASPRGQ